MNTAELIPQHQNVKFDNDADFKIWLEENTSYTVEFFDDGQDLIRFYVAENNEILHGDYFGAATIYNGCFVVETPYEFGELKIYNPKRQPEPYYLKFQIDKVTRKGE